MIVIYVLPACINGVLLIAARCAGHGTLPSTSLGFGTLSCYTTDF